MNLFNLYCEGSNQDLLSMDTVITYSITDDTDGRFRKKTDRIITQSNG